LDTREPAVDGARERLGEESLTHPRKVLHDHVPAGQEGDNAGADHLLFAEDDGADAPGDLSGALSHLHHLVVLQHGYGRCAGRARRVGVLGRAGTAGRRGERALVRCDVEPNFSSGVSRHERITLIRLRLAGRLGAAEKPLGHDYLPMV
jgi:hypothetical protein